jgi:hypothetical protein
VLVGTSNVGYPTFTVEVAKSHESEPQLLSDASNKHFSPMTGVMVWLGIKMYPTHQFSVTLLERDTQAGFGALPTLAHTGFLSSAGPVQATITIPKRLIYHGVPNHLVPPTTTPDFILDLNVIREAVELHFDV